MRRPFAGTPDAVAIDPTTGRPSPGLDATGNVIVRGLAYGLFEGQTQLTDLTDPNGSPLPNGEVVPGQDGRLPRFLGPDDGTAALWMDFGSGSRVLLLATDIPDRLATVEALAGSISGDSLTVDSVLTKGGPVFNVKAYGAAGDDSTNDTAAVQAALDDAAPYGGIVYVPMGVYRIHATLIGHEHLTLFLAPGSVLKRAANVTMFVNGASDTDATGFAGNGNITICGSGTIDMQGAALSGSNNCMSFGHAQNITVRDITIKDEPSYHHLEFNGVKTYRVIGVKFLGFVDKSGTGANYYKEAIQIDLQKGSTYFPSFGLYDDTCSEDGLIEGCYFGPSGTPGTVPPRCAVGGHSATVGKRYWGLRFVNNQTEDLPFWQVSLYATTGVYIAGNEFIRPGAGVRVETIKTADRDDTVDVYDAQTGASQHERGITITGNRFYDALGLPSGQGLPGDLIRVLGESTGKHYGVTITGNTAEGGTGGIRGVRVKYAERVTIDNNTIYNINGYGVWSEHCTDITIGAGNVLSSVANHAVYMTDTTNFRIGALSVSSPTLEGIHLERSGDGRVFGARVKLAGTHGINIFDTCYDITVEANEVKGASRTTNATSSAFRMSSTCQRIRFRRNSAQKHTTTAGALSGNQYLYAFSSTNTCTLVEFVGNSWQDGTAGAGTAKNNAATVAYDAGTDRVYA